MITAGNSEPRAVGKWVFSLRVLTVRTPCEHKAKEDWVGAGTGVQPNVVPTASEKIGETQYEKRLPQPSVSGTPSAAHGTTPDVFGQASWPAFAPPAAIVPSAAQGSRPFAWANPMIASLIASMLRWVSALLRTSSWVESGRRAPAIRRAMIASATASSMSEKPLFMLIASTSGRNDHDPVVDRGGDARAVLEDQVRRRGILSLEIVRKGRIRMGLAVQRPAGENQDRLLVIRRTGKVVHGQARGRAGRRIAGAAAAGSNTRRHRVVRLAVPLIKKVPGDIRVGGARVGQTRQIARRCGKLKGDRRRVDHLRSVLQPSDIDEGDA